MIPNHNIDGKLKRIKSLKHIFNFYILETSNTQANITSTKVESPTADQTKVSRNSAYANKSTNKELPKEILGTKQPTENLRDMNAGNREIDYTDMNKPLITPQSSSNPSTDTTTSPVNSAHYQPIQPDLQRIQLNR